MTVPKRGFRFVAALRDEAPASASFRFLSIAVMPFRNLSSDTELTFLAEGMLEDLVMMLSRIRWLEVIGSSTMSTSRSEELTSEVARANSTCATCSRAACANRGTGCASLLS